MLLDAMYLDCGDVFRAGFTRSGIYGINIPGRSGPLKVYCDMDTEGGRWLVGVPKTEAVHGPHKNRDQFVNISVN